MAIDQIQPDGAESTTISNDKGMTMEQECAFPAHLMLVKNRGSTCNLRVLGLLLEKRNVFDIACFSFCAEFLAVQTVTNHSN